MGSAIDQILRMQDTAIVYATEIIFIRRPGPLYNSKEADGSKRQILSSIGPTPIYVSEHSHGTYPSDSTTH